jgi:hypothetical protein
LFLCCSSGPQQRLFRLLITTHPFSGPHQNQHAKLSLRPHEQEVLKKIQGPKRKERVGKLKKRGPKGPNPLSVKRSAKAKAKAKQMAKASVAQAVAAGQGAQS